MQTVTRDTADATAVPAAFIRLHPADPKLRSPFRVGVEYPNAPECANFAERAEAD
jgi:hypothetical protein